MDLLFELRRRARYLVWPALALCVLLSVAYNIVHGDRGLLAWRALEHRIGEARLELSEVEAERQALMHRVRLLHPQSLNRDMLDEWSRRLLNYGHPQDIVIVIGSEEEPKRQAN